MEAIELDAKVLDYMERPGVYMFVKDDLAIYIGSSKCLGERIFAKSHHKRKDTKNATSLILFSCNTLQEALALEATLIEELRPALNKRLWGAKSLAGKLGVTETQACRLRTSLQGEPQRP